MFDRLPGAMLLLGQMHQCG